MQSISVKSAGDVAEVECGDEVGGSGDGCLHAMSTYHGRSWENTNNNSENDDTQISNRRRPD
jgi:hypothetical protein